MGSLSPLASTRVCVLLAFLVNPLSVFCFLVVIGQKNSTGRQMGGFDPNAQANDLSLPVEFVISKGGAYFFTPSISTLKTKIGTSK